MFVVRVGDKACSCEDGEAVDLALGTDFGSFWSLCEEVDEAAGSRGANDGLGECWGGTGVLKMYFLWCLAVTCAVEVATSTPKHAYIRLQRQQHRSAVFAPAAFLPYARTHNASRYPILMVSFGQV